MSDNTLDNYAVNYEGLSCPKNYAELDVAFTPSETMTEFEKKMRSQISPTSFKINKNLERFKQKNPKFDRTTEFLKMDKTEGAYEQDGIQFPLNRSQQIPKNKLGSNLLESFHQMHNNNNFVKSITDKNHWCGTWMDIIKFLLIIILIILVVYGIYLMIKNKKKKQYAATNV